MQDIKELDNRGIPGGFVASDVFIGAAHSHSEAIGFHASSLFVAHPIQDRTDSELVELADAAFSSAVDMICSQAN